MSKLEENEFCGCVGATNARLKNDSITTFDPINKPQHYNSHPSGIECIEIAEHHNFAIGNAIKYLWRQGLKDGESSTKDLKKAIWYIQNEIHRLDPSEPLPPGREN